MIEATYGQTGASADVLQFQTSQPAVHRLEQDVQGRQHNHGALKAGGEVTDLGVAVHVHLIGRSMSQPQTVEGKRNGRDVHHGLRCVAEDCRRTGQQIRAHLDGQHQQAEAQRQRHCQGQNPPILFPLGR